MASSPPQSASLDAAPSSPDASRYTLNRDRIGSDSALSSPSSEPDAQLSSDDMAGPSDFTINMIPYMTGQLPLKRDDFTEADSLITGTPAIAVNKLFKHLQPTVEEHKSDVSQLCADPTPSPSPMPVRRVSSRLSQSRVSSPASSQGSASAHSRFQITRLNNELATEKRERAEEQAMHVEKMNRMAAEQKEQLQALIGQLRELQSSYQTEREMLSKQHTQEMETANADLQKAQAAQPAEVQDVRASIAAEAKAGAKRELAAHNEELERITTQHAAHIQQAAREIAEQKAMRTREAQAYQDELKRIDAQHVKEIASRTRHTQAIQERHAIELQRATAQSTQYLDDLQSSNERIQALSAAHVRELGDLRRQVAQSRDEAQAASKQHEALERSHAEEIARNTAALEKARAENERAAQDLQHANTEVHSLHISLQEAASGHTRDLERLRDSHAKTFAIHTSNLQTTESELAKQQAYTTSLSSSLQEKVAELEELRAKHAETERLSKALGKQLMRTWGREEFGETGEAQKYRYKHVRV
jgi:hypothetical protein